jgi:integrase
MSSTTRTGHPTFFVADGIGTVTAYPPTARQVSFNLRYYSPAMGGKQTSVASGRTRSEELTHSLVTEKVWRHEANLEAKRAEAINSSGEIKDLALDELIEAFAKAHAPNLDDNPDFRRKRDLIDKLRPVGKKFRRLPKLCDEAALKRFKLTRMEQASADTVARQFGKIELFLNWCKSEGFIPPSVELKVPKPSKREQSNVWKEGMPKRGRIRAVLNLKHDQVEDILQALPEVTEGRGYQGRRIVVRDRFRFQYESCLRAEIIPKIQMGVHYIRGSSKLIRMKDIDKTKYAEDHALWNGPVEILARQSVRRGPIFEKVDLRGTWETAVRKALSPEQAGMAQMNHLRAWRLMHLARSGVSAYELQRIARHTSLVTTNLYLMAARKDEDTDEITAHLNALSRRGF